VAVAGSLPPNIKSGDDAVIVRQKSTASYLQCSLGAMRRSPPWVPGETSLVDHVTPADSSLASATIAVSVATHPDKVGRIHWKYSENS